MVRVFILPHPKSINNRSKQTVWYVQVSAYGSLGFDNPNEICARLFTVPYFFVRSFRYTASYWFSNVPRGRASGIIDLVGGGDEKFFASSQTASRPLSSFDTHPRWQPVTQGARSRRCYAKIEDCEQSKLAQTLCCLHVYLKVKWNVFWQGLSYVVLQQFREKKKHDLTGVKSKPSEVISNYFRDPKKMIRHYGLKL